MPIGPTCCVADVTPDGRPDLRRTRRTRYRRRARAVAPGCSGCRTNQSPRHGFYEGELVRRRRASTTTPRRRRRSCRSSSGSAGAPAVHALGRARLGQLRPGVADATSAPASTRRASSSRSTTRSVRPAVRERRRAARPMQLHGHAGCPDSGDRRRERQPGTDVQRPEQPRPAASRSRSRTTGFKTALLRAGTRPQSAFATEQMIDELAYAAKMDPVAFRLQNIATGRPVERLARWRFSRSTRVAKAANWQPRVAASNLSRRERRHRPRHRVSNVRRRLRQTAGVADIEVNKKTGKIIVKHVYAGRDAGLTIYPGRRREPDRRRDHAGRSAACSTSSPLQQDERHEPRLGHAIRSCASRTPRRSRRSSSSGVRRETLRGRRRRAGGRWPSPAAVANAFFDATGVRMHTAPLTPARVRAALKAAGVA